MTDEIIWTLEMHRGYLHYWYGYRPNLHEEGSVEHDEWQEGWEYAVAEDATSLHDPSSRDLEYTQE